MHTVAAHGRGRVRSLGVSVERDAISSAVLEAASHLRELGWFSIDPTLTRGEPSDV